MAFSIPFIAVNTENRSTDSDISVYIKTNGVHTDIVVPIKTAVKDWSTIVQYSHIKSKDSTLQFIGFGWGDQGFYLNTPEWSDLKVSTALVAASGLGTSAIHATLYKGINEDENCIRIKVSEREYQKLVTYIQDSFKLDKKKNVQWIHTTTYGQNDSFYEANGSYSLFFTCNTWANSALKAMNQKAALWTPTDTGIFRHYR